LIREQYYNSRDLLSLLLKLWKGTRESWGYVLVGLFLSAVFGILHLLMVCADGLSGLLTFLEGGEWTWEWLTGGSAGQVY
jgi:hypothetical protein